jgi:hypothetical protein
MSVERWQGPARSSSDMQCIGQQRLSPFADQLRVMLEGSIDSIDLDDTSDLWTPRRAGERGEAGERR